MNFRTLFGVMTLTAILSIGGNALAQGGAPNPIDDCPEGLVCFTWAEWARINEMRIDLRERAKIAEAKLPGLVQHGAAVGYYNVDGNAGPFAQYELSFWKLFGAAGIYDGKGGLAGGIRFTF